LQVVILIGSREWNLLRFFVIPPRTIGQARKTTPFFTTCISTTCSRIASTGRFPSTQRGFPGQAPPGAEGMRNPYGECGDFERAIGNVPKNAKRPLKMHVFKGAFSGGLFAHALASVLAEISGNVAMECRPWSTNQWCSFRCSFGRFFSDIAMLFLPGVQPTGPPCHLVVQVGLARSTPLGTNSTSYRP